MLERVAALEARLKVVEVEWEMWYDKFRRLLASMAKRAQREEASAEPKHTNAPGSPNGHRGGEGVAINNPLARRLMSGPGGVSGILSDGG